jgi:adenosylhomocysteinase
MDMSFANQALSAEYLYSNKGKLDIGVHVVPPAMDAEIGRLKLQSMGIAIDVLSAAQQKYQDSWQEGT